MVLAEKVGTQDRGEKDITMRDSIIIGLVQVVSLIPGVSRSGATISAGLFVGLDRVAATRMAFFLSIPALTGAGIYELPERARRRHLADQHRRRDGRQLRRRVRRRRLAAEVRRAPLDRLVRRLPGGGRRDPAGSARHRHHHAHLSRTARLRASRTS